MWGTFFGIILFIQLLHFFPSVFFFLSWFQQKLRYFWCSAFTWSNSTIRSIFDCFFSSYFALIWDNSSGNWPTCFINLSVLSCCIWKLLWNSSNIKLTNERVASSFVTLESKFWQCFNQWVKLSIMVLNRTVVIISCCCYTKFLLFHITLKSLEDCCLLCYQKYWVECPLCLLQPGVWHQCQGFPLRASFHHKVRKSSTLVFSSNWAASAFPVYSL